MAETPADLRDEVKEMQALWAPIEALLGGTVAMRRAGETYLPKHPAENQAFYDYRKSVSTLFNGLQKTIETMSGKPFSEPMKFSDDMPTQIKGYCDDIDLEGRNLQAFSHELFRTGLGYGLSHVLVDFPAGEQAKTVAEQKASGARPYFVHIRPPQVLGWRSARINGAETLTQLRLMESVSVDQGAWSVATIDQVRVLYRDHYEIYRKNDKNEWLLFDDGPVSLGLIPLATVYTGRTGFMTACPPLLDLAYLNIEHWQSSSDQSNILHVARVPILFGAGFPEGTQINIGAQTAVQNDDVNAKLTYVEHSGEAISAGRQSIQDIEERMRALGAQLLVKNSVGNRTTATEKSIDSAEQDSALSLMALNLQDSINQALSFMAKWDRLDAGGSVVVYREFDEVSNDTAKGDLLLKMRGEGAISAQTTFEEGIRLGVLGEERTWDEELARMKAEGPVTGVIGNYEGTPGSQPAAAPAAA